MPSWLKLKIRRWSIYIKRRSNLRVKLLVGYVCFLGFFSLIGERGLFKSFRLWQECKSLDRQVLELQSKNKTLETQVYLFRHCTTRRRRKKMTKPIVSEIMWFFIRLGMVGVSAYYAYKGNMAMAFYFQIFWISEVWGGFFCKWLDEWRRRA